MINKKSLWFLTLFSLILVLSIYYITMPSELLLTSGTNITPNEDENISEPTINIEESDLLVALRVESDEEMAKRRANWQPREPKVTTGYLARYREMVTSGNRGAILEIPKKN